VTQLTDTTCSDTTCNNGKSCDGDHQQNVIAGLKTETNVAASMMNPDFLTRIGFNVKAKALSRRKLL
jgi:uncharacterized metal-binding protein